MSGFMSSNPYHGLRLATLAAMALGARGIRVAVPVEITGRPSWRERLRRRRIRGKSTLFTQRNGARECARRRRQIAAGSLREANGLCQSNGSEAR